MFVVYFGGELDWIGVFLIDLGRFLRCENGVCVELIGFGGQFGTLVSD